MDTKFDFGSDAEQAIVYVRTVNVADLPRDVREQAEGLETLYAVHTAQGERLALVHNRSLAFALARKNHMHPVMAH